MDIIKKPTPKDKEITLSPCKILISKTDKKGIIEYTNDYFIKISGYKEWELVGKAHNIIRHPDMPQIIFKILWGNIEKRRKIYVFIKNLAKDGSYYWVIGLFEAMKGKNDNEIKFYAKEKPIPDEVKKDVGSLYNTLLNIEKKYGVDASEKYFKYYLEDLGMHYHDFILHTMRLKPKQLSEYIEEEYEEEKCVENDVVETVRENIINKRRFFW